MSERSFLCLALILFASVVGHGSARTDTDVLHYAATLEPDIAAKSVKGSVLIHFSTTSTVVELDCGELTIDAVRAAGAPLQFSVTNRRLRVPLPSEKRVREIEIDFHGTPKYGIRFFPDRQQVYTVFSTCEFHDRGVSRTSIRTRRLPARDRDVPNELRESSSSR